jgi:hypothetical protein
MIEWATGWPLCRWSLLFIHCSSGRLRDQLTSDSTSSETLNVNSHPAVQLTEPSRGGCVQKRGVDHDR